MQTPPTVYDDSHFDPTQQLTDAQKAHAHNEAAALSTQEADQATRQGRHQEAADFRDDAEAHHQARKRYGG